MSDILPDKHREMFAARGRGMRLQYRMDLRNERIRYERAAVHKIRTLLAPQGVPNIEWRRDNLVCRLNEVLTEIPILHAAVAFKEDAPLDTASRHPQLHKAFLATHQLLRQSGTFPAPGVLRDFVRNVDELTPDATDNDRLRIVADSLSAYGIVASVTTQESKEITPGTIFVRDQPFALPDLTPNQPGDIPKGWTTSYARPLEFETLSYLGGIPLRVDSGLHEG